jgi:hypothetical protein
MTRRERNGRESAHGRKAERGLLLEAGEKTGIALTSGGRFLAVRCLPQDEVGQEVYLDRTAAGSLTAGFDRWLGRAAAHGLRAARPPRTSWSLRPGLAVALSLVLCLLIASPFAVGQVLASGDPAAYVTIDINPSLELGVNRWDRVVTATPLNDDGRLLLDELEWRGRPVTDVVFDAVRIAAELGYLNPEREGAEGVIIVAAAPAGPGRVLSPGLTKQLDRILEELPASLGRAADEMTVATVIGDASSLRDQAQELGLSIGRYSILLAAQEEGLDLESGDLEGGLGRAIINAGGHPGQVLREANQIKTLSKLAEKFQDRNGLGPDDRGGSGKPDNGGGEAPPGRQGDGPTPGDDGTGSNTPGAGNPGVGSGNRGVDPDDPDLNPSGGRDNDASDSDNDEKKGDRPDTPDHSPEKPGEG